MTGVIIYSSVYGTGKTYAYRLRSLSKFDLFSYDEIKDLDHYDTIIYIGSIYAGIVKGMRGVFKRIDPQDKKLILITIGIVDPMNKENQDNIKNNIKALVSNAVYSKLKIYHLKGAIDYQKLSLKHRFLMYLIYKKASKSDPNKQSSEEKAILETYKKTLSFVDFDELKKIWEEIYADIN